MRPRPSYRSERTQERYWEERNWERPQRERPTRRPAEKAAEKPAVPPSYFVAVLGDSLGQKLGQGLAAAFADHPEVAILNKSKENSGLVRDDFYDWVKATQDLLASNEKINFAVMMIGSNDRQVLRDGKEVYEPRSPQWEEIYGRRIEAIAAMFRDKKIPLVWVGLPILKSEQLSADASAFNEFYREFSAKAGATYVDIWEAFADDGGQYSSIGPDINGQIVRLRAADGIHFTKAGARKLAHFVEPEIRRNLDETHPHENPDVAPDIANVAPSGDAGAEGPNLPAEEQKTAPAAPVVKPIAGPVLPLTAPALAPDGQLATRMNASKPASANAPQTSPASEAAEPRPGRANDFSWPRP